MKHLDSALKEFIDKSEKGSLFYADLTDCGLAISISSGGVLKYQIWGIQTIESVEKVGVDKYGKTLAENGGAFAKSKWTRKGSL